MSRKKLIESPEELEELFNEFKIWAKENPYKWHDFVGKDAEEVWKERERPITWIGFEGWLCQEGIITQLTQYERPPKGYEESYAPYLPIVRAIKRQCSADVVQGALAGVYNQNIAARLEGLKDTTQTDLSINAIPKIEYEMPPGLDG